jgi:hypothetical protein
VNVPLFLRLRGGESEVASVRYHLHYAAESALTALITLFPIDEVELPEVAVLNSAHEDAEYRRINERSKIVTDRVLERVSPEAAEHVHELLRVERQRADRLALIAFRLAVVVRMPLDPPTG